MSVFVTLFWPKLIVAAVPHPPPPGSGLGLHAFLDVGHQ